MAVLSEVTVGDILYQNVDSYPMHSAPTGSVALFAGNTFINTDGSTNWHSLYKPVFGEIYYSGNVTATNPAQNAWNNDNGSAWVAGSMRGLTLSNGTLTASNSSISGLCIARTDSTITSATSRIYTVEIGPAYNNFAPTLDSASSVASSDTDKQSLSCIRVEEIGGGNYFNVGKRWTVIGGSGGQSGFIVTTNKLSVMKIANKFTNTLFTDGFETGTFSNWTTVNGSQTNKWVVSTNSPNSGVYSAHISDSTTLTYTNTVASITHIYTDIAFSDASSFQLTFNWKCTGETNFDYGNVYVAPNNVTPVAGASVSITHQVGLGQYNGQAAYQSASITLSSAHANQTKRLIFSWVNDGSVGTNPPFQIDNVQLVAITYN